MMNTKRIKEIGKWMMVIGGTIFTAGAGTYFSAHFVEKREEKQIHKTKLNRIEEEERIKNIELRKIESEAKAEKDKAYAKQLEVMDKESFAKFHAERVAVANQSVLDKASRIQKESEAAVVQAKLDCKDEIAKIREECLKKIEEANEARDEAVEKYEAINTLFINKNEVLEAKEALDLQEKQNKAVTDLINELKKTMA